MSIKFNIEKSKTEHTKLKIEISVMLSDIMNIIKRLIKSCIPLILAGRLILPYYDVTQPTLYSPHPQLSSGITFDLRQCKSMEEFPFDIINF